MNKVFKFPIIISTVFSVIAGVALADTKIGMITTLSGGGAGLGVDVRDGFMLAINQSCLLYTSPSPRDRYGSRMPSSA